MLWNQSQLKTAFYKLLAHGDLLQQQEITETIVLLIDVAILFSNFFIFKIKMMNLKQLAAYYSLISSFLWNNLC